MKTRTCADIIAVCFFGLFGFVAAHSGEAMALFVVLGPVLLMTYLTGTDFLDE